MKDTKLFIFVILILIALAFSGGAFMIYKDNADKKEAAESERKVKIDEVTKRLEREISDLIKKQAMRDDAIEREARNAEKLAKSYQELIKSKIEKNRAESDAQAALIELETAKKLLAGNDPEKRKAIEAKLEKPLAESNNQ